MAPIIEERGLRDSIRASLPQDLIGHENIDDLITRAMATAHRAEADRQENDDPLPQDRVGWIITIIRGLSAHDRGRNQQPQQLANNDPDRMDGGRTTKQSKKRSTTRRRRRRSSKARKARKSRTTRRK